MLLHVRVLHWHYHTTCTWIRRTDICHSRWTREKSTCLQNAGWRICSWMVVMGMSAVIVLILITVHTGRLLWVIWWLLVMRRLVLVVLLISGWILRVHDSSVLRYRYRYRSRDLGINRRCRRGMYRWFNLLVSTRNVNNSVRSIN
jgi:hypothetical protein